jgi:hypothetical protein
MLCVGVWRWSKTRSGAPVCSYVGGAKPKIKNWIPPSNLTRTHAHKTADGAGVLRWPGDVDDNILSTTAVDYNTHTTHRTAVASSPLCGQRAQHSTAQTSSSIPHLPPGGRCGIYPYPVSPITHTLPVWESWECGLSSREAGWCSSSKRSSNIKST